MKKRKRSWKGWALVENGELCHYYGLHYVCCTKKQAKVEMESKNRPPLDHKMKVVPVLIKER